MEVDPAISGLPPLVTVGIPLYNHAPFIAAALESLKRQTYPRLEVIVIDDGSTDGSAEAATAWRHANATAFESFRLERQANQGVARTLRRLLDLGTGQYFAPLPSDDEFLPAGISAMVEEMQRHPDDFAVFGHVEVINEIGGVLHARCIGGLLPGNPRLLRDKRSLGAELILRWAIAGPVFLFRAAPFKDGRADFYDESLLVEDRDLALRLLAARRLRHVPATVGRYRIHETNYLRRDLARRRTFRNELVDVQYRRVSHFHGFEWLSLTVVAKLHGSYFHANDRITIRVLFWAGMRVLLVAIHEFVGLTRGNGSQASHAF